MKYARYVVALCVAVVTAKSLVNVALIETISTRIPLG